MPRIIGIILIVIAVAGIIIHSALGLHIYINDAVQIIFGDSAIQTYGSAIGEGVVYLVFYFIGAAGLAFVARDFHAYVMRVTSDRTMELKTILLSASDPLKAAVYCAYMRMVADGQPATTDVVDVFDLAPDGEKFAAITIICDTPPVRPDFDRRGVRR